MRRPLLVLALGALAGCSVRAGTALLPQLSLRASARMERSETRARWRHDVRLVATFRTDAPPPPPLPVPVPDRAPVSGLRGRHPCRLPSLCAWEQRARRDAFAAYVAGPEP